MNNLCAPTQQYISYAVHCLTALGELAHCHDGGTNCLAKVQASFSMYSLTYSHTSA